MRRIRNSASSHDPQGYQSAGGVPKLPKRPPLAPIPQNATIARNPKGQHRVNGTGGPVAPFSAPASPQPPTDMAEDTVFSKIVRGEIPADIVYRDDLVTAFRDISPITPTHVLIVPNETIPTLADVSADDEPVLGRMLRVAADIAAAEGIAEDGYRVMINCRDHGGQEVYHLHLHLMGGRPLGGMVRR